MGLYHINTHSVTAQFLLLVIIPPRLQSGRFHRTECRDDASNSSRLVSDDVPFFFLMSWSKSESELRNLLIELHVELACLGLTAWHRRTIWCAPACLLSCMCAVTILRSSFEPLACVGARLMPSSRRRREVSERLWRVTVRFIFVWHAFIFLFSVLISLSYLFNFTVFSQDLTTFSSLFRDCPICTSLTIWILFIFKFY